MSEVRKNKTIKAWVTRHVNDIYVKDAYKDGYRSRAAYKLRQFINEEGLFHNVRTVIDLGCAPGSWSQVAVENIAENGFVVGVDLIEIQPLNKLKFIQGDFTEDSTLQQLLEAIQHKPVDLIISDMSPNLSGVKGVDQVRGAYLIELVLELANEYLKVGGNCLIKIFHGSEFDNLVKQARKYFKSVVIKKPKASRSNSSETYLLCKNKLDI